MTNPDTNLDWVEKAWGTGPVPGAADAVPRAHARDCAVETGPGEIAVPVPSPVSPPARARDWAARQRARAVSLAEKKGSLAQSQPPTFEGALRRHHECAGHYDSRLVGGGRLLYGYVHTVTVKPVLNYLEWATDSPLSLTLHALLGVAVWLGLLWGGYL
jgi:hypothetical protein